MTDAEIEKAARLFAGYSAGLDAEQAFKAGARFHRDSQKQMWAKVREVLEQCDAAFKAMRVIHEEINGNKIRLEDVRTIAGKGLSLLDEKEK